MKNLLIAVIAALALTACTSEESAVKALTSAGYSDITITGYGWFDCSEDDTFATRFKAKGPTGQAVEGTVCKGMLKGSTIRLD